MPRGDPLHGGRSLSTTGSRTARIYPGPSRNSPYWMSPHKWAFLQQAKPTAREATRCPSTEQRRSRNPLKADDVFPPTGLEPSGVRFVAPAVGASRLRDRGTARRVSASSRSQPRSSARPRPVPASSCAASAVERAGRPDSSCRASGPDWRALPGSGPGVRAFLPAVRQAHAPFEVRRVGLRRFQTTAVLARRSASSMKGVKLMP
jgi:hypothetical protein